MKKLRSCAALLLSLVMILSLLPAPTGLAASESTNLSCSVSAATVDVGETFTVTLSTKEMTVSTFTGGINYDPDVVEYQGYTGFKEGSTSVRLYYTDEGDTTFTTLEAGLGDQENSFGISTMLNLNDFVGSCINYIMISYNRSATHC